MRVNAGHIKREGNAENRDQHSNQRNLILPTPINPYTFPKIFPSHRRPTQEISKIVPIIYRSTSGYMGRCLLDFDGLHLMGYLRSAILIG